ncbi:MAG: 30S ribosomal protein S7 [Elusimicrobia bacterium]|nr:30S ribosomal protein S7 [Elusimicrobiota bacterium]MBU2615191.1 30S ribosomal protein S7 [Elusimicrobiota bacterium]
MPRKPLRPKERRKNFMPDARYNSVLLGKFLNKLNFSGQKSVAERIIYSAFNLIKDKLKEDPLKVFIQAIENVRPLLEVKARRVGGATYQVPVETARERSETIAMRWLIQYAQEKKGVPMHKKLADELMAAYKKEGSAMKKREDTHKMADANKAFAHYRW